MFDVQGLRILNARLKDNENQQTMDINSATVSFSSKIASVVQRAYFHVSWCHAPKGGAWRFNIELRTLNLEHFEKRLGE
jgi:hypothetical protein